MADTNLKGQIEEEFKYIKTITQQGRRLKNLLTVLSLMGAVSFGVSACLNKQVQKEKIMGAVGHLSMAYLFASSVSSRRRKWENMALEENLRLSTDFSLQEENLLKRYDKNISIVSKGIFLSGGIAGGAYIGGCIPLESLIFCVGTSCASVCVYTDYLNKKGRQCLDVIYNRALTQTHGRE